jgi:hypothetical protein
VQQHGRKKNDGYRNVSGPLAWPTVSPPTPEKDANRDHEVNAYKQSAAEESHDKHVCLSQAKAERRARQHTAVISPRQRLTASLKALNRGMERRRG